MLRFQTSAFVDPPESCTVDNSEIQAFLRELPTLLQSLCKRDIQYTICGVLQEEEHPLLLQLILEVIPNWFQEFSTMEDNDYRRLGIKEPERTRGTIAVNLWLLSLQRYGEGPLQTAWKEWQKQQGQQQQPPKPCPIMLVQYSIT